MRKLLGLICLIAGIAAAGHSSSTTTSPRGDGAPAAASAVGSTETPEEPTSPRTPTSTPVRQVPNYRAQAAHFVRSFYEDINGNDYAAAWHELSFDLRSRLGNYHDWKVGYETTVSVDPHVTVLRADRRSAALAVTLKAADLDACGDTVHRTFSGHWQLARADHQWLATAISFEKVAGREPVTDINDCPGLSAPSTPTDSGDPCDPSSSAYDPSDPSCETPTDSGDPCDPSSAYYDPSDPSCDPTGDPGSDFCETHDCIPNFDNGNGYPVQCADGTWSDSGGIQGACSHHGGEG